MKKLKTKMLVLAFSAFFAPLSKGQQTRKVDDFNGIKITDSFTIIISQSDVNTVTINADTTLLPKIKTEITEGILNIRTEDNIKNEHPIIINIAIKSLNSLNVSGSTDIKTANQLNCSKLFIESGSAGNVSLDVKADEIKTQINGIGDVALTGSAEILDANVSGAGDLRASNLEVDKAKVNVSGTGNAKINVKQTLDADITGTGSIIYKGKPVVRNITITGTGSVRESKSGNGEETTNDTTKLKFGKKKYSIIHDGNDLINRNKKLFFKEYNRTFKNWTGIEFGINGLLDNKNSLDVPPSAEFLKLNYSRSFQFGINLLEKDFHIFQNYLNIVTGFGFDFNHYALQKDVTLSTNTDFLSAQVDSSFYYKKNKLNVSYIKAPLLLELNTSKNSKNNLHIAIGFEFAWRIHAVQKQKKELGDKLYKIKIRDDFNLQPFRYSAVARLGFKNITLFANYGINRLFLKNQGPQVYPFTIGLAINFNK